MSTGLPQVPSLPCEGCALVVYLLPEAETGLPGQHWRGWTAHRSLGVDPGTPGLNCAAQAWFIPTGGGVAHIADLRSATARSMVQRCVLACLAQYVRVGQVGLADHVGSLDASATFLDYAND